MSLSAAPVLRDLADTFQRHRLKELSRYLRDQRWFQSKARALVGVEVVDLAAVDDQPLLLLMLVRCSYDGAEDETYLLPLRVAPDPAGPDGTMFVIPYAGRIHQVQDATRDSQAMLKLAAGIRAARQWPGVVGRFLCTPTPVAATVGWPLHDATAFGGEQSNSTILLDRSLVLKLLRKLQPGVHPDLEVLGFLTSRQTDSDVPRLVGSIEYRSSTYAATVSLLQEFVPNHGDGWSYVLRELGRLLQDTARDTAIDQSRQSKEARQLVMDYARELLTDLAQLGAVTGRLHVTLASGAEGEPFGPERIGAADIERWQQTMARQLDAVFTVVESASGLDLLTLSPASAQALREACRHRLTGLSMLTTHGLVKIRQHGDYHLGQVLKRLDGGFAILDFEGEPARPLAERRAKGCVFKDLAGMRRSFGYAAAVMGRESGQLTEPVKAVLSEWEWLASRAFLSGYEETVRGKLPELLPPPAVIAEALRIFEIDKAVYELGYELNNRPAWAHIPLHALQRLCALPDRA